MTLRISQEIPAVDAFCSNCRWHSGEESEDGYKRCVLYGHFEPSFPALMIKVPGDDSTILLTHKSFGCVQFEAFRIWP